MKILVTGSRGWCGVGIVKGLLERGHEVVGLDVSPVTAGYEDRPDYREIQGDVTDQYLLASLVQGCDAVVHAAVGIFQSRDAPDGTLDEGNIKSYDVTVTGTLYLLEAMRQNNVRQFVLLSSAAVVLDHIAGPNRTVKEYFLDAQTPLNFSSFYGLTKLLQERLAAFYARQYNMSVVALRLWWVVDGPTYRTKNGVPLAEDTFYLSPTGMLDRYDLGEICHLALQRPDIVYEIFYPVAGPHPERYFDVERVRRELGWQPRYTFEDVVRTR
ncbi:MAG: NAD(P)-dependent oxidoreductase [Anaerolineae bacterium]|nr:NAD(P)-dependent oxidoreductase [Anaerolineae bacterium]